MSKKNITTDEVKHIAKLSKLEIPDFSLHCIKLYETPKNFIEYYGPDFK